MKEIKAVFKSLILKKILNLKQLLFKKEPDEFFLNMMMIDSFNFN